MLRISVICIITLLTSKTTIYCIQQYSTMLRISVICIITLLTVKYKNLLYSTILNNVTYFGNVYNYFIDRQRRQFISLNNAQQCKNIRNLKTSEMR